MARTTQSQGEEALCVPQTLQMCQGEGNQLFREHSPAPHALFGIWIWERAEAGGVGWTSACALPLTAMWSRCFCLRVSPGLTHAGFLAPSGWERLPWAVADGFVEPYEPISNPHPASKGMALQPCRLLKPTWNELRTLTNSAIIMEASQNTLQRSRNMVRYFSCNA